LQYAKKHIDKDRFVVIHLVQNGVKIYPENLTHLLIVAECFYNKGQINGTIALRHSIEQRARGCAYFTDLLEKNVQNLGMISNKYLLRKSVKNGIPETMSKRLV
jgi:hypothetical protein